MLKQVPNGVQTASMDASAVCRAIAKDTTIHPALLSKAGWDLHTRHSVARPDQGNEPPPFTSPKTIAPNRSNVAKILPNPAYTGQFRAFRRSSRPQPAVEIDCRSYPVGRWKGLNSK